MGYLEDEQKNREERAMRIGTYVGVGVAARILRECAVVVGRANVEGRELNAMMGICGMMEERHHMIVLIADLLSKSADASAVALAAAPGEVAAADQQVEKYGRDLAASFEQQFAATFTLIGQMQKFMKEGGGA